MGWLTLGFKLVPLILAAVNAVERLVVTKNGKDKQNAAIDMVGDLMPLIESSIGREIVNESSVQDAMRKVIDAVVALQNVISDVRTKKT